MKLEIVIAGGGFAGVYCAKSLARALGKESIQRVGLIAEQNIMVFQPMLAEVAGAMLSPLDVVNPLRQFCRGVNVLRGRILEVDLAERRLILDAGRFTRNTEVEFDHLVLALGSVVDLTHVPGMPEHSLVLKTVGDALKLKTTVINRLEEANLETDPETLRRLLTFVVVGGGYSGVESAGQILDLLERAKRFYHSLERVPLRVVLIHSGPTLLPEVGESLGRYAERKLRERGMEILLNTRVTSMTSQRVSFDHGDPVQAATVLSTVGNAPHPVMVDLCRRMGLETYKGRVVTEPTMQVKGRQRLWAAGDSAAVPVDGQPASPPTAQFAQRQGKLLGENIARSLRGEKPQAFHHKNLGQMASIGRHTAVAEILGMRFSGFLTWWMWRMIYLAKLPGIQRKLRVIVDWTLDLFFPRNISLLLPEPTELVQESHSDKGCVIFHAGEPARLFYIVKTGRIDFFEGDRFVRSLRAGQHFGERTLLGDGVWHHSAMAAEPSTLVAVSRKAFKTLWEASSAFQQSLTLEEVPEEKREAAPPPGGGARVGR
jgi:NADH dehydrogenase